MPCSNSNKPFTTAKEPYLSATLDFSSSADMNKISSNQHPIDVPVDAMQAPQAALPGSASFGRSGPGYASFASPSSVPITPSTPSVKVNNAAGIRHHHHQLCYPAHRMLHSVLLYYSDINMTHSDSDSNNNVPALSNSCKLPQQQHASAGHPRKPST